MNTHEAIQIYNKNCHFTKAVPIVIVFNTIAIGISHIRAGIYDTDIYCIFLLHKAMESIIFSTIMLLTILYI